MKRNTTHVQTPPVKGTVWYRSAFSKTILLILVLGFSSPYIRAQTFPAASSCTSKDLELREASLPVSLQCNPAKGDYPLVLSIFNKTGSTRTASALWGTLVVRDINGNIVSTASVFACIGPIEKNKLTTKSSSYSVAYEPGRSYEIVDIYLAWTTSNNNENCAFLESNPSGIAPKCGTQGSLKINVGIEAQVNVGTSTCAAGGASVTVTGKGGVSPYRYSFDGTNFSTASTSPYTTTLTTGSYTLYVKDNTNCTKTFSVNVVAPEMPVAEAGAPAAVTCASPSVQIGESPDNSKYTYSWSPSTGLDNASISNPTATPLVTTEYTVTKTSKTSGCSSTDKVVVTLNKPSVSVSAGDDFKITCVENVGGKQIGEVSEAGYSYAWLATTGLSNAAISDPVANPSSTTTYTVTKTHVSSGCYNTDQVTVTVSDTKPGFTLCITQPTLCSNGSVTFNASGGTGFEYSLDGGTSWGGSATITGLGAGSVSGFAVRNSDGCVSNVVTCGQETSSCTEEKASPGTVESREQMDASIAAKPVASASATPKAGVLSVKAFPNPFSSKVSFSVSAPAGGYGSIELFNAQGQKITTVFQGRIPAGSSSYEYYVPGNNGLVIYVLRVGDKTVSGKLVSQQK